MSYQAHETAVIDAGCEIGKEPISGIFPYHDGMRDWQDV